MRKIIAHEWMSLDGVMQAPSYAHPAPSDQREASTMQPGSPAALYGRKCRTCLRDSACLVIDDRRRSGMGFNGEIIVVRSQANPGDLGRFIATESHEVRGDWPLTGGWRAIHVRPFAEPYEYDNGWLAEVSATTGAPVLACWVFESDVAHIRGLSGAGAWECWLNLPYAASMLVEQELSEVAPTLDEEDDPDVFDRYRSEHFAIESARLEREIPLAAEKAAAWAAQTGHAVPAEPIEELLRAPRELFIQWGFFKLLYRLGLTDTDFDPDAED